MKLVRLYIPLVLPALVIIALDQWTKWLVRENIPFAGQWLPQGLEWLMPYARLVHWYNTGAAFGMFQGFGWIFGGLAIVVAGVICYYYPQIAQEDGWLRLALSLQLAGALGNLIDRLILEGKVTDFISVGSFPVFNIADASITMGVGVLMLGLWIKERAGSNAQAEAGGAGEMALAGTLLAANATGAWEPDSGESDSAGNDSGADSAGAGEAGSSE